jgi:lysophospholipase L1-like esterase
MDLIYKLHPKKVFLNGGTNDFVAGYSVEEVFTNYKKIIKLLQEHHIKPYMQSVVYTSYVEVNGKITEVNKLLEEYCLQNEIIYINLNSKLSINQRLLDKYTLDGSHLNAQGYVVWREVVENFM